MRKQVWTLLLTGALATGALAVACGDDDDNPATTPKADGGPITPPPPPGPPVGDGGGGGDAGCTFAGYVIGLINTQTTAQAAPTTDLGDMCTPSTSQDDFKTLFP